MVLPETDFRGHLGVRACVRACARVRAGGLLFAYFCLGGEYSNCKAAATARPCTRACCAVCNCVAMTTPLDFLSQALSVGIDFLSFCRHFFLACNLQYRLRRVLNRHPAAPGRINKILRTCHTLKLWDTHWSAPTRGFSDVWEFWRWCGKAATCTEGWSIGRLVGWVVDLVGWLVGWLVVAGWGLLAGGGVCRGCGCYLLRSIARS